MSTLLLADTVCETSVTTQQSVVQHGTVLSCLCRYQSTVMGSFQTVELIETFINYQESIKRCITIIYDPQRSALGGLAIKACSVRWALQGRPNEYARRSRDRF